jgi:hypothetical protein
MISLPRKPDGFEKLNQEPGNKGLAGLIIEVQIPLDKNPGDQLVAAAPDGRQIQVVVPDGAVPGESKIQIQFPADTNQAPACFLSSVRRAYMQSSEALTNQLTSVDISINSLRGYRQAQSFSFSDAGSEDCLNIMPAQDEYCGASDSASSDFGSCVEKVRKNVALAEAELDRFANDKRETRRAIESFKHIDVKKAPIFARFFDEICNAFMDRTASDAMKRYLAPPETLLTGKP